MNTEVLELEAPVQKYAIEECSGYTKLSKVEYCYDIDRFDSNYD